MLVAWRFLLFWPRHYRSVDIWLTDWETERKREMKGWAGRCKRNDHARIPHPCVWRVWMKRSNRVSIHLSRSAWKFARRANLATSLCQPRWQSFHFMFPPRLFKKTKRKKNKSCRDFRRLSVSSSFYSTITRFLSLLHTFFFVLYRSVWKISCSKWR